MRTAFNWERAGGPMGIAFGGFVATAVIATVGGAAQSAAAYKLVDIDGAGVAIRALNDLASTLFASVGAPLAILIGAASLAAALSGDLPRWLVAGGAVAAVLEVATLGAVFVPVLGLLAPLLLVAWSLAAGVVLSLRGAALFPGTARAPG